MMTLYGIDEAANRLGMPPGKLRDWLDEGHYEPDYRAVFGDDQQELFSDHDLAILARIRGTDPSN